MNSTTAFLHKEYEAEKASNSYLMSLIAIMVGLPFPIINLLATFIFYMAHSKKSYFIRWHCTQALLSQLILFFVNSIGFWWTINIIYLNAEVNSAYLIYLACLVLLNLIEFIATIYAAIETRKGKHVKWIGLGRIVDAIVTK
ncbi:DUF4870 domain-containing protein [Mesonia sp.]|uniref:DUF4870 domain-containing protein n=1 Tax=Mesonia sp. TaxID=1960830 RepID=UPI003F993995